MKMNIKGVQTKKETVFIEVSIDELCVELLKPLKVNNSEWIQKNQNGLLAIFEDCGGSHYSESEMRLLTDEEVELYNSVKGIEKFYKKNK